MSDKTKTANQQDVTPSVIAANGKAPKRKRKRKPRKSSALVVANEGLPTAGKKKSESLTRARKKRGFSTKLPEVAQEILETMTSSLVPMTVYMAAAEHGVPKSTVATWLMLGRSGDPDYSKFFEDVQIARERSKLELIRLIKTAGSQDSANLRFLVERMFPEEFGQKLAIALESDRGMMLDAFEAAVAEVMTDPAHAKLSRSLRLAFFTKLSSMGDGN